MALSSGGKYRSVRQGITIARAHRAERRREVPAVGLVVADVRSLPAPEHGEEVVCVAAPVVLPPLVEKSGRGRVPEIAVKAAAEECLAIRPARIHATERLEAAHRRALVAALRELRIRQERGLDALQKYEIVR